MNKLKGWIGNIGFFVVVYIVAMLPTYRLPYMRAAASLQDAFVRGSGTSLFWTALGIHIVLILFLIWLTQTRGEIIEKKWIAIFPFLAGIFDLVPLLNSIPLIPTIMHLAAIIMGVIPKK